MSFLNLSQSNRDALVFHVWKSLKYKNRIAISLIFILVGFLIQAITFHFFPGILGVLLGNLLLLNKGIDTRIQKSSFNADTQWVKTTSENLTQIIDLNRKLSKWDKSAFDVTNTLGLLMFLLLIAVSFLVLFASSSSHRLAALILFLNLIVLVVPHWLTGIKRISTTPKMVKKIKLFQQILSSCQKELKPHTIEYNVLLKGEEKQLPKDLKIRINLKDQPDEFLGLYGQMNMNTVEGKVYPYFYTVLVAKKQMNILANFDKIKLSGGIIKEKEQGEDTDVIIIRQHTTKKSGYHTRKSTMVNILKLGINNAGVLFAKE